MSLSLPLSLFIFILSICRKSSHPNDICLSSLAAHETRIRQTNTVSDAEFEQHLRGNIARHAIKDVPRRIAFLQSKNLVFA